MINFPTIIVDNFYKEPDKIREFALKQEYLDSTGHYPGKRTRQLHELNRDLFDGFCSKLFSLFYNDIYVRYEVNTSFWKVSTLDTNPLSPKNMGFIHKDFYSLLSGVVYLTPGIDINLGTTIYKQNEKNKISCESDRNKFCYNEIVRNKFYTTGKDDGFDNVINEVNSRYREAETTKIANEYNRLICFDSSVPHAPSHYYMGNETRLVQVFFVDSVESSIENPIKRIRDYDNIPYDSL